MRWLALCTAALASLFLDANYGSPRPLSLDPNSSRMTVHVAKEGLFSFAGDAHDVDVPIASGFYDPATQTVALTIAAATLQVQDPPSRRDRVEANMLGPEVLDVQQYPTISFRSTSIQAQNPTHWSVTGDLTLHGQTHPVMVQVDRLDVQHFSGSAVVMQSAFGITPITVAGGAVRVKDPVSIDFSIALR